MHQHLTWVCNLSGVEVQCLLLHVIEGVSLLGIVLKLTKPNYFLLSKALFTVMKLATKLAKRLTFSLQRTGALQ